MSGNYLLIFTMFFFMVQFSRGREPTLSADTYKKKCENRNLPWYTASRDEEHICCGCQSGYFIEVDCSKKHPTETKCQPCPDGTFTSEPNTLKECHDKKPRTSCDKLQHTVLELRDASSDDRCVCKPGAYSPDPEKYGCKIFQKCSKGFGVVFGGNGTHDVECILCSDGMCSHQDSSTEKCSPCKDQPPNLISTTSLPTKLLSTKLPPTKTPSGSEPVESQSEQEGHSSSVWYHEPLVWILLVFCFLGGVVITYCWMRTKKKEKDKSIKASSVDLSGSDIEKGSPSKDDSDGTSSGLGTGCTNSMKALTTSNPKISFKEHSGSPTESPHTVHFNSQSKAFFSSGKPSPKESSRVETIASVSPPPVPDMQARQTKVETIDESSNLEHENEALPINGACGNAETDRLLGGETTPKLVEDQGHGKFDIKGNDEDVDQFSYENKNKLQKISKAFPEFDLSEEMDNDELAVTFLTGVDGLAAEYYETVTDFVTHSKLVPKPNVLIDDKRIEIAKPEERRQALLQAIITKNGKKLTVRKLLSSSRSVTAAHALFEQLFIKHLKRKYKSE